LLSFFLSTHSLYSLSLSLHDALPISFGPCTFEVHASSVKQYQTQVRTQLLGELHQPLPFKLVLDVNAGTMLGLPQFRCCDTAHQDRKSTRLNSSHVKISYAVFCLKKK